MVFIQKLNVDVPLCGSGCLPWTLSIILGNKTPGLFQPISMLLDLLIHLIYIRDITMPRVYWEILVSIQLTLIENMIKYWLSHWKHSVHVRCMYCSFESGSKWLEGILAISKVLFAVVGHKLRVRNINRMVKSSSSGKFSLFRISTIVRGLCRNRPTESLFQCFPGCVIGDFLVTTCARNWIRTRNPWFKAQ